MTLVSIQPAARQVIELDPTVQFTRCEMTKSAAMPISGRGAN